MTRHRVAACLIGSALILGLAGSMGLNPCSSEEPAKPKQARGAVAVMDVNHIFKNSKSFTEEIEAMKADVTKASEDVKKEQEKIKSQLEEMGKLAAGSDERTEKEDYLSKLQAALTASVNVQKQKFIRREAALYLKTYQRIETEAAAYAKENGIDLVVRLQTELDANKPESVLQHINKPIIWASPEADITSIISERIDKATDSSKADEK
jgi:Skp family chaperone for outer membrane proteins